ncbi:MAG: hypothetical protein ACXWC8_09480 [Limisphaerales bacterium]
MHEDLQLFLQSENASPGSEAFVTSVVDLRKEEREILAGFKKSTAYDVRRAKDKDRVVVEVVDSPTEDQMDQFSQFFDIFAVAKGIGRVNRRKLSVLAAARALTLSMASVDDAPCGWLAAHAYIVANGRARLLYSASRLKTKKNEERAVIARGNKFMHWWMLVHFKSRGVALYDFGGISKREELRGIDEFKESFGGKEVVEYNCTKGVTLKGKLAVFLLCGARQLRALRSRL